MSRLSRAVSCVAAIVCLTGTPAFANMGESGASSTEANFVAGREAIEKQDWEGALNALRKAVAADPGNATFPVGQQQKCWGVGVNRDNDGVIRVYFARQMASPALSEIWSVELDGTGEFVASTAIYEFDGPTEA